MSFTLYHPSHTTQPSPPEAPGDPSTGTPAGRERNASRHQTGDPALKHWLDSLRGTNEADAADGDAVPLEM